MNDWNSRRFGKRVHLTHHATERIDRRGLSLSLVQDLIETGTVKQKDPEHWWIFQAIQGRDDNLVCAAVTARQAIIIKTIMTYWEERDG